MDTVEINGLRIAYERVGTGPPLVCLHGFLADSRAWRPQLEDLSSDFTVVAWDAPGCGGSDDPPDHFRFDEYVGILDEFLRALRITEPNLLGLSWGGVLALAFYDVCPEVPRSLILADTYAGWAGSLSPGLVAARVAQAERDSLRPAAEWVPDWIPTLLHEPTDELRREVETILSEFHPVGYRVMAHAVAEIDLRPALARVDVPTLVLYGEHDQRSPVEVGRRLHEAIPGSKLVVIPRAGHVSNVDAPARFDAEVRAFLAATAPPVA